MYMYLFESERYDKQSQVLIEIKCRLIEEIKGEMLLHCRRHMNLLIIFWQYKVELVRLNKSRIELVRLKFTNSGMLWIGIQFNLLFNRKQLLGHDQSYWNK